MNADQEAAAEALEAVLLGKQGRILTSMQQMAMDFGQALHDDRQGRAMGLRAQADAIEAEGREFLERAVLAIRAEYTVPQGVRVTFEQADEEGHVLLKWTNPTPEPAPASVEQPPGTVPGVIRLVRAEEADALVDPPPPA